MFRVYDSGLRVKSLNIQDSRFRVQDLALAV
jgi:hypothetical protein